MKNRKGFTLVEIMIVVAIIALLAAIAIPNLLNARRTANTAAAKANVHTLCTELETYAAGTGNGLYYSSDTAFTGNSTGALKYCGNPIGGYNYTCVVSTSGYAINATRFSPETGDVTKVSGITGGQVTLTP